MAFHWLWVVALFLFLVPHTRMKKPARLHFPRIRPIAFEGTKSSNALAFRHYNPEEIVDGQTMEAHMRFSIAYWHSFRGTGSDPFGPGTIHVAHTLEERVPKRQLLDAVEIYQRMVQELWKRE